MKSFKRSFVLFQQINYQCNPNSCQDRALQLAGAQQFKLSSFDLINGLLKKKKKSLNEMTAMKS